MELILNSNIVGPISPTANEEAETEQDGAGSLRAVQLNRKGRHDTSEPAASYSSAH
jgi:hypothetical protein